MVYCSPGKLFSAINLVPLRLRLPPWPFSSESYSCKKAVYRVARERVPGNKLLTTRPMFMFVRQIPPRIGFAAIARKNGYSLDYHLLSLAGFDRPLQGECGVGATIYRPTIIYESSSSVVSLSMAVVAVPVLGKPGSCLA